MNDFEEKLNAEHRCAVSRMRERILCEWIESWLTQIKRKMEKENVNPEIIKELHDMKFRMLFIAHQAYTGYYGDEEYIRASNEAEKELKWEYFLFDDGGRAEDFAKLWKERLEMEE